jgi:hypothetical protein
MKALRASLCLLFLVTAFSAFAGTPGDMDRDPLAVRNWNVDFSKMKTTDRVFGVEPDAVPTAASHFVAVVPCRVVDTRLANGPYGGPAFVAEETRTYDIPAGPCSGIPTNAAAYSVELTVTQTLGPGFLTAWPTGTSRPTASSLNYETAPAPTYAIANAIIVAAGTSNSIDIFSKAAGHVIVDINGYFVEGVVTALTANEGLEADASTGAVTVGIADDGVTPAKLDATGSSAGDVLTSDGTDASWQPVTLPGNVAYTDAANVFTAVNTFNLGLSANGQIVSGVATPVAGTDAANKAYVDGAVVAATGFVKLSPATTQTTTSTNDMIDLKLDRTGSTLGVSGTSDLLSLSAAGDYAAIPLDKERFRVDNSGGVLAVGGDDGTIPATGSGTRMMFYAKKGAFRVGNVNGTQWDDNKVAPRSFASGKDTEASGNEAFAGGNNAIASGSGTVALGTDVTADDTGAMLLGDRSNGTNLTSTAQNQFLVRAAGGTIIYSNGALTSGVTLAAGGGSWSSVSDYHRKENFELLNGEDVLQRLRAIPVSSWNYKSQDASIRHIGPMAQDFHAAFGVGEDEKLINTIDIEGVSIAAAKALETRTAEQQAEINALKQRNTDLEERLRRLESLLTKQQ